MFHIHALILAAGSSTRMGKPKQFLDWNGKTLIRHAVETVQEAGLSQVTVVAGLHFSEIQNELKSLNVHLLNNTQWEKGMGSSISVGVSEIGLKFRETQGILILLCDQPRVSAKDLRELIQKFNPPQFGLVASEYQGTIGVPAVIGQSFFRELQDLDPSSGAKAIFSRHRQQLVTVPVPEAAMDLDTPEHYARELSRRPR